MGRKRNRPPNWVSNEARAEVKLPHIGDIGCGRPRARWAFVVGPARQASESFVLEDLGDGDRAEGMSLVGQIAADVVDGEVLLSQGDDAVTEGVALGCGMKPLGRSEEEVASGTLAELVDKDVEAPRGVTETASHLDAGETVDEEGAASPFSQSVRGIKLPPQATASLCLGWARSPRGRSTLGFG